MLRINAASDEQPRCLSGPEEPITVARATERYATWIRGNYAKGSLPSMLSTLRRFGELFDGTLVTGSHFRSAC